MYTLASKFGANVYISLQFTLATTYINFDYQSLLLLDIIADFPLEMPQNQHLSAFSSIFSAKQPIFVLQNEFWESVSSIGRCVSGLELSRPEKLYHSTIWIHFAWVWWVVYAWLLTHKPRLSMKVLSIKTLLSNFLLNFLVIFLLGSI